MKLCILSDIHDELAQLSKALEVAESCDAMLCCGDLCSPFVVHHLGKGFKKPMHVVFGNNDGDLFRMTQFLSTLVPPLSSTTPTASRRSQP